MTKKNTNKTIATTTPAPKPDPMAIMKATLDMTLTLAGSGYFIAAKELGGKTLAELQDMKDEIDSRIARQAQFIEGVKTHFKTRDNVAQRNHTAAQVLGRVGLLDDNTKGWFKSGRNSTAPVKWALSLIPNDVLWNYFAPEDK